MKWLPTAPEIMREALIVIGGALLAAIIIGQVPALKTYIKDNWSSP